MFTEVGIVIILTSGYEAIIIVVKYVHLNQNVLPKVINSIFILESEIFTFMNRFSISLLSLLDHFTLFNWIRLCFKFFLNCAVLITLFS